MEKYLAFMTVYSYREVITVDYGREDHIFSKTGYNISKNNFTYTCYSLLLVCVCMLEE